MGSSSPSGGSVGRLVARDVAVAAQAADDDRGEPLTGGGASALAVEDPGDRAVVVVDGEPLSSSIVSSSVRIVGWWRGSGTASSVSAPPCQRIVTVAWSLIAVDVEDDFLDQTAQQLLAVAVGGGRRGPHAPEIGAEREQTLALGRGQRARPLLLAQRELGFGLGELSAARFSQSRSRPRATRRCSGSTWR